MELNILQNKVLEKIKELRTFSQKEWGVSPEMKISYDLDSMRTLGAANFYKKTMRLNKHLLLEFGETYINEIVVHEYAHFVVKARMELGQYGNRPKPHGKEFKHICSRFGISGKATTSTFKDSIHLKEKSIKNKSSKSIFYYKCGCIGYKELSSIRHKKVLKGSATYRCSLCGKDLLFVKRKSNLVS